MVKTLAFYFVGSVLVVTLILAQNFCRDLRTFAVDLNILPNREKFIGKNREQKPREKSEIENQEQKPRSIEVE